MLGQHQLQQSVGKAGAGGSRELQMTTERLLGETVTGKLEEQIVFSELSQGDEAVWSLLLASGYLRAVHHEFNANPGKAEYELQLTNREVRAMFGGMPEGWFRRCHHKELSTNNCYELKAVFLVFRGFFLQKL